MITYKDMVFQFLFIYITFVLTYNFDEFKSITQIPIHE